MKKTCIVLVVLSAMVSISAPAFSDTGGVLGGDAYRGPSFSNEAAVGARIWNYLDDSFYPELRSPRSLSEIATVYEKLPMEAKTEIWSKVQHRAMGRAGVLTEALNSPRRLWDHDPKSRILTPDIVAGQIRQAELLTSMFGSFMPSRTRKDLTKAQSKAFKAIGEEAFKRAVALAQEFPFSR